MVANIAVDTAEIEPLKVRLIVKLRDSIFTDLPPQVLPDLRRGVPRQLPQAGPQLRRVHEEVHRVLTAPRFPRHHGPFSLFWRPARLVGARFSLRQGFSNPAGAADSSSHHRSLVLTSSADGLFCMRDESHSCSKALSNLSCWGETLESQTLV